MNDLRKAAEMAYKVMTDIHQVCDGANHKRKDMHPYGGDCPIQKRFDDAWEALRQALAQPEQEPVDMVKIEHDKQVELAQAYERGWNAALAHEQEPVAWMSDHDVDFKKSSFGTYPCVPLYTAPPKREWVGLTDEEIEATDGVEMKYIGTGEYVIDGEYEFARAIEAKLKEKNT